MIFTKKRKQQFLRVTLCLAFIMLFAISLLHINSVVKQIAVKANVITLPTKSYEISSQSDLEKIGKTYPISNEEAGANVIYYIKSDFTLVDYTPIPGGFSCAVNGEGHTLSIKSFSDAAISERMLGLFNQIQSTGSVSNLSIMLDFDISDNLDTGLFGAVAVYNNGRIENCHVFGTAKFSSIQYAGGLVSRSYGKIRSCSFGGVLNGGTNSYVGGISARLDAQDEAIKNCYSYGSVIGDYVGGFASYVFSGEISFSVSRAKYTGATRYGQIAAIVGLSVENLSVASTYYEQGKIDIGQKFNSSVEYSDSIALDSAEFKSEKSFDKLDFDNFWHLAGEEVKLRTLLITSEYSITANKKYYYSGEVAIIKLNLDEDKYLSEVSVGEGNELVSNSQNNLYIKLNVAYAYIEGVLAPKTPIVLTVSGKGNASTFDGIKYIQKGDSLTIMLTSNYALNSIVVNGKELKGEVKDDKLSFVFDSDVSELNIAVKFASVHAWVIVLIVILSVVLLGSIVLCLIFREKIMVLFKKVVNKIKPSSKQEK